MKTEPNCSIDRLCQLSGISRQAFYKKRKRREKLKVDHELVVELVNEKRSDNPRMGTRKLHYELQEAFDQYAIQLGRDRLFDLLRSKKLLIHPKKKWIQTTDSRHSLEVYENLIKELTATCSHQIWVADITYIRTAQGWIYLSLIMDLVSRKIVGFNMGDTLEANESIKALDMAIRQLPKNRFPIHHSDRGSQYCCHEYVSKLKERRLPVSMTEINHCAENCYAERVNGIIKGEYNLDLGFKTKEQARKATLHAIRMYNDHRPHNSLGMLKPSQVHQLAA